MPKPIYITGAAGTGKTTKLLERTASYAKELITAPHHQLLAMAYMHGARRRLESSLEDDGECKKIPRTVSTIDSFALSLLNRWRTGLGITLPVCAAPAHCMERFERHNRLYLPFAEITAFAANLLVIPSVARIVAASYPLVAIDEFQDCTGPKLDFVRAFAGVSQLILAADAFQLLDGNVAGCPAVEWVEGLGNEGLREFHRLTEPHRFVNQDIFLAARSLRERARQTNRTVPLHICPIRPAAWHIMERLRLGWYGPRWTGTTALIVTGGGQIVDKFLQSLGEHTSKQRCTPIYWNRQAKSDVELNTLYKLLGVTSSHLDESDWMHTAQLTGSHVAEVVDRALRFARLRGLHRIPKHLVTYLAEQVVHTSRAHGKKSSRYVITTIHGAKNCEFDNVIVVWTYQVPPEVEVQRRWLYNAITRAKTNCIVVDTRSKAIVTKDEIVMLLGDPTPIFPRKPKTIKVPKGAKTRAAGSAKK